MIGGRTGPYVLVYDRPVGVALGFRVNADMTGATFSFAIPGRRGFLFGWMFKHWHRGIRDFDLVVPPSAR
jgi:hypothetical protein